MKAVDVSETNTGSKIKKKLRDFSDNFFATALAQCTHTPHIVRMYAEGMHSMHWYILEAETHGLINYKDTKTKCRHPIKLDLKRGFTADVLRV